MANGHDDGSDVVTSLETNSVARALLSFQGPHRACSEGFSAQAGLAPKAANEYIGRRWLPALESAPNLQVTSQCSGGASPAARRRGSRSAAADTQPRVPAPADLQNLPVDLRCGKVEP